MGTFSYTPIADGTTADVADVNVPFQQLAALLAAGLDSSNITPGSITNELFTSQLQSGWIAANETWTYGTNNGQKEQTITISGDKTAKYQAGHRMKVTRGTTPPTQCTDLESSSSQYASKSSPAGLTFTDDFTCEAWVKLESYGTQGGIVARRNVDTEGWSFTIDGSGRIVLAGLRIAGNNRTVTSYQSVPLDKWVHVAATLDMSGNTGTVYINGALVPSFMTTTGAATALVQGTTDLVVGATKSAGTESFDGKISDVRVWDAIRSAANIRDNMNQQLIGTETNLIGYWKLNGNFNDSDSNANNLTAQNSAAATNADNPMNSTEYGIITSVSYSAPNTTLTVFTGTDYNIPNMTLSSPHWSAQKAPYGFPALAGKWKATSLILTSGPTTTLTVNGTWVATPQTISAPTGTWVGYGGTLNAATSVAATRSQFYTVASSAPTNSSYSQTLTTRNYINAASGNSLLTVARYDDSVVNTSQTTHTLYAVSDAISGTETTVHRGDQGPVILYAQCAYV